MSESASEPNLFDQLAHEFAERQRRGERPPLTEYTDKYPQLAAEIRDLFPALVVMEQFGSAASPITDPCGGRTDSQSVPVQLGEYRVLREVARGGMGIVYEAVQESLGRHVALKVLPAHRLLPPTHLERFRREARAAAKLHHTNIVPVFGVGEDQGVHFYAMQFIQGQGLDSVLRELQRLRPNMKIEGQPPFSPENSAPVDGRAAGLSASLAGGLLTGQFDRNAERGMMNDEQKQAVNRSSFIPHPSSLHDSAAMAATLAGHSELTAPSESQFFQSVARVGVQVAEALAYAHVQGILHRDVKPSNLLLDTQGVIWITDFGLAKLTSLDYEPGEDALTHTGDIVGTLRYMAPERFEGRADARSDVFSLGLTLYELATLEPAFSASQRPRLIEKVLHEEPPRPRKVDPHVPRDLETIILKAIAKEPEQRYPTAAALAEDLRRFLADRPILARRSTWRERGRRWCRRNPVVASLLGVIAAMILVVIVGVIVKNAQLSRAVKDYKEADEAAKVRLWESLYDRARAMRMSRQPGQRLESLKSIREAMQLPLPPGHSLDELRTEAIAALALPDIEKVREWEAMPTGTDGRLAFDAAFERYARVSPDGTVSVRKVADDSELFRWQEPDCDDLYGAEGITALSPDGRHVALYHSKGQLRVRRLEGETPVLVHKATDVQLYCGAFTPDGKCLLYGLTNGHVAVLDLDSGGTRLLPAVPGKHWLRIDPTGQRFSLTTNVDGKSAVEIRDLATGSLQVRLPQSAGGNVNAWHPDGRRIAVADGNDQRIRLWDSVTGQLVRVFEGNKSAGIRIAFSPSGRLLLSNDWSDTLRIWEVSSGKVVLSVGAAGYGLVSTSKEGLVPVVDPVDRRRIQLLRLHDEADYRTVARREASADGFDFRYGNFTEDGRLFFSTLNSSFGGAGIAIVDAAASQEVATVPMREQAPLGMRDGALLSSGAAGLVRLPLTREPADGLGFRLGPPERLHRFQSTADVDQAGRIFAFPAGNQGAVVWRADQPDRMIRLQPQADVRDCAVSPDGRWVATGTFGTSRDDCAKVWDAETGQLIKTFQVGGFCRVRFSPDGRWLLTTSDGGPLWQVGTWQRGPDVGGLYNCFSPDSQLLATEGESGSVRLVETDTGREIARLASPERTRIVPVAFSPDGTQLVAVGADTLALHIWDLRGIRSKLRDLGLDWEARSYPPAPETPSDARPPQAAIVQVEMGRFQATLEAEKLVYESNRQLAAKQYAKAIGLLRQAIQKDPENAEAHNNLGWFLTTGPKELRNSEEAVSLARKAVELSPLRYL